MFCSMASYKDSCNFISCIIEREVGSLCTNVAVTLMAGRGDESDYGMCDLVRYSKPLTEGEDRRSNLGIVSEDAF